MAKRANKRRTSGKRKRTAGRSADTKRTASTEYAIAAADERSASTESEWTETCEAGRGSRRSTKSAGRSDESGAELLLEGVEPPEDLLDDPFFYESPFPPEVVLEALEPPPAVYTSAMIARRRKLRTFVAMVVGAAATIVLLGLGQTMW